MERCRFWIIESATKVSIYASQKSKSWSTRRAYMPARDLRVGMQGLRSCQLEVQERESCRSSIYISVCAQQRHRPASSGWPRGIGRTASRTLPISPVLLGGPHQRALPTRPHRDPTPCANLKTLPRVALHRPHRWGEGLVTWRKPLAREYG